MNILFDTLTFLWFLDGDEKLSDTARSRICDLENTVYFSAASYWEICIKISIGKLRLEEDWRKKIDRSLSQNRITWLNVDKSHMAKIIELPWHHRDPFDRLLVAQSMEENCQLCSADSGLSLYGIEILA